MCKRSLSSSCLCMIRVGGAGKRAAQCSGPVGHEGGEREREREERREGGRKTDAVQSRRKRCNRARLRRRE